MQKSDSIANLAGAMLALHRDIENPRFDKSNNFIGNPYVSQYALTMMLRPLLCKHNLVFMQFPKTGGIIANILMHAPSGEWIWVDGGVEPKSDDPQAGGSAFSYSKRYGGLGIFFIAGTDDDDDGNEAQGRSHKDDVTTRVQESTRQLTEDGGSFKSTVLKVAAKEVGQDKKYTLFDVFFSNGVAAATFDQKIAAYATELAEKKTEVDVIVTKKKKGYGYDIVDIQEDLPF